MMNSLTRPCRSLPRRLLQLPLLGLFLLVLFASEAQAAITITPTSASPTSAVFLTDFGKGAKCNYVSFNVTTDTDVADVWLNIGTFTGPLSLGGGDNGSSHLGPMLNGETRAAFFYVCSSFEGGGNSTTSSGGYTVTAYSGNPASGGATISATPFIDITIDDGTIAASQNTVNAIWADINPSVLGATTTLTVDGDTGTIGCTQVYSTCPGGGSSISGPLTFTPAAFTDWRADAYELVGVNIVLSDGNTGTYNDVLFIDNVASGSTTHYVATYYFRPIATTASTTTLSPVAYISGGTQMKHTSLDKGAYATAGGLLPILPAVNKVSLTKSVSHATLPAQGGVVTYTLSATNTGGNALSLDSFIDTLPTGAVYVPDSTTFNNVSFPNPTISGSQLNWSSLFDIPAYSTRSLIFQATLPGASGTYTNSATALVGSAVIDTTLSTSDYVPATAETVILNAPTISKGFSPIAMAINASSTLTLTIGNINTVHTLNGIAISDTLPAGLVFDAPPNAATDCAGAALSITGTTISVSGGTITPSSSCTVSVDVTASTNGSFTNTTDAVSSSNGGTGGTASATLTTTPKPTISKAFSVSTIPVDGTATMSFAITNNTAAAITGMTFSDTYPVNLVNAVTPNVTNTCGGTITAAAGGGSLSLAGGGIATAGGTCSISVDVTSATAGDYANTTSGVETNESTIGPVSNTSTLFVLAPPTVSKAFSPSTIGKGQTSTLTITLTNSNATAITGAAFTDTYPADLLNAATTNLANSCGGTSGAVAGGSSLSLSGGSIPASSSCEISVDVTSDVINLTGYDNTLAIGALTTTNANSNTVAATSALIVNATPTINKSFNIDTANGIGTMIIVITNNDAAAITNLSFTDLFPTGMLTDNPPSVSPAEPCGVGSSIESWNGTTAGTLTATGGDLGIKLTAGQIAGASSCTFSINLTVNSLGVYQNQTSGLTSDDFIGTSSVSNIATWIAPSVGKTFTPTQVTPTTLGPSDISRLIITITNPSSTMALTGLTINDVYPTTAIKLAGGVLDPAAITSPTPLETNTCGGTLTATSTGMTLSGGTLAPGASCSIAADVLATNTTPAIYANTTDNVASDQGMGISGGDTLIITTKPTIEKSFLTTPVILTNGTTSSRMQIIVENNSGTDITDVEFSDIFPTSPSQMVWEGTFSNSCGGALTDELGAALVAGSSTGIKLTGGAILSAIPSTCTIEIDVSVTAAGTYYNTTTGAISSVSSEVGPVSNTAELVAHLSPPTATKSFANAGFQVNNPNTLTITLSNENTDAITSMAFTDTYPANMANAAAPNISNTCGGTVTAAAGAGTLSITGGAIPAGTIGPVVPGTCTIEVDITATAAGAYTNTLLDLSVTSANSEPGPAGDVTASATAYLPPTLTKSFGAASLGVGSSTTLTLTLTNPASNPDAITDVRVDDTFPAGMTLQDVTFGYTPAACGTVTRTDDTASVAGDGAIRFGVTSLAAGVSCEVSVNITSSTAGAVTNTTDAPIATAATAMAALTGTTAWDSITVQSVPSIMLLKSVQTVSDPVNIATNPKAIPGAIMLYNIIATNSGAGSADLDSTMVFDPIPTNTLLYVDDIGGAGSGPVLFTQGATSSTLSYTFTNLADSFDDPTLGDDLSFSNDGGTLYNATPTFDAVTGCDTTAPPITHIRVNPKGTFVGGNASFQIWFRVCVQ